MALQDGCSRALACRDVCVVALLFGAASGRALSNLGEIGSGGFGQSVRLLVVFCAGQLAS